MSGIRISLATKADLQDVLDLYQHLNPGDRLPPTELALQIWDRMRGTTGLHLLVRRLGPKAVASCVLIVVPNLTRAGRAFAVIENVVTHGDFRRRGFGTAILKHAVDLAWSEDCYKIVLTTGSRRDTTLAFYEKAGFQRATRTAFELRRTAPDTRAER